MLFSPDSNAISQDTFGFEALSNTTAEESHPQVEDDHLDTSLANSGNLNDTEEFEVESDGSSPLNKAIISQESSGLIAGTPIFYNDQTEDQSVSQGFSNKLEQQNASVVIEMNKASNAVKEEASVNTELSSDHAEDKEIYKSERKQDSSSIKTLFNSNSQVENSEFSTPLVTNNLSRKVKTGSVKYRTPGTSVKRYQTSTPIIPHIPCSPSLPFEPHLTEEHSRTIDDALSIFDTPPARSSIRKRVAPKRVKRQISSESDSQEDSLGIKVKNDSQSKRPKVEIKVRCNEKEKSENEETDICKLLNSSKSCKQQSSETLYSETQIRTSDGIALNNFVKDANKQYNEHVMKVDQALSICETPPMKERNTGVIHNEETGKEISPIPACCPNDRVNNHNHSIETSIDREISFNGPSSKFVPKMPDLFELDEIKPDVTTSDCTSNSAPQLYLSNTVKTRQEIIPKNCDISTSGTSKPIYVEPHSPAATGDVTFSQISPSSLSAMFTAAAPVITDENNETLKLEREKSDIQVEKYDGASNNFGKSEENNENINAGDQAVELFTQISPSILNKICNEDYCDNNNAQDNHNVGNNDINTPRRWKKIDSQREDVEKLETVGDRNNLDLKTSLTCGEESSVEIRKTRLKLRKKKRFSYPSTSQIKEVCPKRVFSFKTENKLEQLSCIVNSEVNQNMQNSTKSSVYDQPEKNAAVPVKPSKTCMK